MFPTADIQCSRITNGHQVVLEWILRQQSHLLLPHLRIDKLIWPSHLLNQIDRITVVQLKFNCFLAGSGFFTQHSKFEIYLYENPNEFQLTTHIYAFGEHLPTAQMVESTYLNKSQTTIAFENAQVSRFLAKLLMRVNGTISERPPKYALICTSVFIQLP
ncbi:hypothetical protein ACTXT7_002463 [Hymenolepis weldensis]